MVESDEAIGCLWTYDDVIVEMKDKPDGEQVFRSYSSNERGGSTGSRSSRADQDSG